MSIPKKKSSLTTPIAPAPKKNSKKLAPVKSESDIEENSSESHSETSEDDPLTFESQKELLKQKFQESQEAEEQKGVIYLPKIPPYMKASYIREYFKRYKPLRIYLTPEDDHIQKNRTRKGGNRKRKYMDGWIEFCDKRVARYVAGNFNGTQVGGKKQHFYYSDIWNLRYLAKFKWRNLTEKLEYDRKVREKRLNHLLRKSKKNVDSYVGSSEKSKQIKGMLVAKAKKLIREGAREGGKGLDENDRELVDQTIAKSLIRNKKISKQNVVKNSE
jgi:hypothetical protein